MPIVTGNIFGGVSGGGTNGALSIFGGSASAQPTSPVPTSGSIFGSPSTGFGSFTNSAATPSFGSSAAFQQQTVSSSMNEKSERYHYLRFIVICSLHRAAHRLHLIHLAHLICNKTVATHLVSAQIWQIKHLDLLQYLAEVQRSVMNILLYNVEYQHVYKTFESIVSA